jgi:hypothetical protein
MAVEVQKAGSVNRDGHQNFVLSSNWLNGEHESGGTPLPQRRLGIKLWVSKLPEI